MPLDDSAAEAGAWQASTGDVQRRDPDVVAGPQAVGDWTDGADALSGRPVSGQEGAGQSVARLDADALSGRPTAGEENAGQAVTRRDADEPGRPAGLSDPGTWLIAALVTAVYTVISVFRYLRRDPTSWDLGIFTEYVKQYARLRAPIVDIKGAGFNLLGDHFHPIVALIAPFFRLAPTPVTLLAAQALLVGVSVLPVSQLGRELLGRAAGRSVAAAYGLSWGLQQMANYDFHEIAFAVPLLAFSLRAMVRGRTRAAVLWALPLVFVKEDQGFTLMAIGLIMAFGYRRYGAGLFLECWGLFWSLLAIMVIIPHFSTQHSYQYWADAGSFDPFGGHFSVGGLWSTFSAGAPTKLPTLVMILLPTAFIALRSPVVIAAIPSLALRAIDTNPSYWGTDWHYNATVMPIVFIAAIDAIARIRAGGPVPPGRQAKTAWQRWRTWLAVGADRYGAAAMLAICAALAFQFPLSSLWAPSTYALGAHVAAENKAMALVPDGATVSTDLDLLAPLAARTDTYWLGRAAVDPAADYVVFDTGSTDWQPPPQNVPAFVENLQHGARYRQIFASDGVYVFRRAG